jgi:ataxin-3
MSASEIEYWIYHEQQEALLCGQHALNNLVQAAVFSANSLAEIAHQLDEMELTFMSQNNEGGIR